MFQDWLRQAAAEKVRQAVLREVQGQLGAEPPPGAEPQAGCEDGAQGASPPCHAGVLFALGAEAGGLEDLLHNLVRIRGHGFVARQGELQGRRVVVFRSGPGGPSAAKATETLLDGHRPGWLISAGFAGGLSPALARYDVLMAESLTDLAGNRLATGLNVDPASLSATPGVHVGRLLTADRVIRDPAEKRAMGEKYQALAVDMETFAVAEVCRRRRTPMLSVRIVSDTVDEQLAREIQSLMSPSTLASKAGAVLGAVWRRPSTVKDMWQLRETALVASDRLARFLASLVGQLPNHEDKG